jgi:NADPH2:quinone reductase
MKSIQVTAFGGPEALVLTDIPAPTPKAGEALVKIAASGINYTDITQRSGKRPGMTVPFAPGVEASGIVEEIGAGVTDVAVGDRVMYAMVSGSYAEYATVPADKLVHVPADLDLVEAAALPLQGFTAHYLLHEFRKIGPGSTVLVHAAAGGVGLLLTQYATHLGAHVIGTTSTAEKAAKAKAAGAKDVILYTETDFADAVHTITCGVGVDLILDAVGKTTFPGDMKAAKTRGNIVMYGSASGQADPVSPNSFSAKGLTVSGAGLAQFIATRADLLRRADDLLAGINAGWLKLSIERIFTLDEAPEAHRLLESRATSGKLLIKL